MASDEAVNIFSFATGALAVLGSATSALFYYYHFFPSPQMEILEKAYRQTQEYYEELRSEGMLPDVYAQEAEVELKELEDTVHDLRDQAYKCNGFFQELTAVLQGLSRTIGKVIYRVGHLKSKIATVSEEQRKLRRQILLTPQVIDPEIAGEPSGPVVDDNSSRPVGGMIISHLPAWPISGFLSGNNSEEADQETGLIRDPASDTESLAETLVDTPIGWNTLRLAIFLQQWMNLAGSQSAIFTHDDEGPTLPTFSNDTALREVSVDDDTTSHIPMAETVVFYLSTVSINWPSRGPLSYVGRSDATEGSFQLADPSSDTASITETVVELEENKFTANDDLSGQSVAV